MRKKMVPRHEHHMEGEQAKRFLEEYLAHYKLLFEKRDLYYYSVVQTVFDLEARTTTSTVLAEGWHDLPEILEINTQAKAGIQKRRSTKKVSQDITETYQIAIDELISIPVESTE
jgi:hypothetical protein